MPRTRSALEFFESEAEALVYHGLASDIDDAFNRLYEWGDIDPHLHARLLSAEAREQCYGSH
jgi:hypothetical protein